MIGLTYIRKLYGLTMEELAQKLNVSKQTVSKWESGKVKLSTSRLKQLTELFNFETNEYFTKELESLDEWKIQKMKISNELKTTDDGWLLLQNSADSKKHWEFEKLELKIFINETMGESWDVINECQGYARITSIVETYSLLNKIIKSDNYKNLSVINSIIETVSDYYKSEKSIENEANDEIFGEKHELEHYKKIRLAYETFEEKFLDLIRFIDEAEKTFEKEIKEFRNKK